MKTRTFTARERIAWGSPVICLGIECKAADVSIANGTLLKPEDAGRRRKRLVRETVHVEMVEGLGGRSLQDLANGPCMEPLRLFLPEGRLSEDEWRRREMIAAREAGC